MRREMMGFWDGSGISCTICKKSAPHSRQITTPTPHHSIFTGWMLFLTPNQQCQSTEGKNLLQQEPNFLTGSAGWYRLISIMAVNGCHHLLII